MRPADAHGWQDGGEPPVCGPCGGTGEMQGKDSDDVDVCYWCGGAGALLPRGSDHQSEE